MNDRHVIRSLGAVAVASPLFALSPLLRRWHLRWGATDAEVAAPMPGDEILSAPSFNGTRAITIDAPPDVVWPWLVQIGRGRAGWYSYDFFDNGSRSSADRIMPEYQDLEVGQWVPMSTTINDATAFKVKGFASNRWLLWEKPDSTWSWKLTPLDQNRTRLVTRLKGCYAWRRSPGGAVLSLVLLEFADFPMIRRLLLNLKQRAEYQAQTKNATNTISATATG